MSNTITPTVFYRMSCAIGASETETGSTSRNGCLICGTFPLIQTSAAPRKTQANEAVFHLLLVLTQALFYRLYGRPRV
jgi:hypothetical protein